MSIAFPKGALDKDAIPAPSVEREGGGPLRTSEALGSPRGPQLARSWESQEAPRGCAGMKRKVSVNHSFPLGAAATQKICSFDITCLYKIE